MLNAIKISILNNCTELIFGSDNIDLRKMEFAPEEQYVGSGIKRNLILCSSLLLVRLFTERERERENGEEKNL